MIIKRYLKKYSRLNIFILAVLLLLGFSLFYFLYYRQRSQADIFVTVSVLRPPNTISNAPFNWVPYWLGQSINKEDKEVSPLGQINAIVVDKNVYEGPSNGQYVYLTLKINAIRDRSGVYLLKNKPLVVGSTFDFKLSSTQLQGLVIYIGKDLPKYETKKIIITIKGREVEPWMADNLKIGSSITDSHENVIAKVLDKKDTQAEVRADTAGGLTVVSYDRRKRDMEATLEVSVKKIDDIYYFMETNKVKVNEWIFLPFHEVTLNLPIIDLKEIE